jgi:hypothetical protein
MLMMLIIVIMVKIVVLEIVQLKNGGLLAMVMALVDLLALLHQPVPILNPSLPQMAMS